MPIYDTFVNLLVWFNTALKLVTVDCANKLSQTRLSNFPKIHIFVCIMHANQICMMLYGKSPFKKNKYPPDEFND